MLLPSAISAIFEKIASTHTGIRHDPDNGIIRYYGFNATEATSGTRSELSYPCLLLDFKGNNTLPGKYYNQAGNVGDNLQICVEVLAQVEPGDFTAEYAAYDTMKQVMDDIVTWLHEVVVSELKCDYPAVGYMDLDTITYQRVGPVLDKGYGWRCYISLLDSVSYNPSTNPLNNMTP